MNTNSKVEIGGQPFLDYARATPREAVNLAKQHKERYLSKDSMAWAAYSTLQAAMRRAVNAPDPKVELDKAVAWAAARTDWTATAYEECAAGFLKLLPKGATGIRVRTPRWSDGDLTIVVRNLIGLRLRTGEQELVLPYVKEPALDQATADFLLCLMEEVIDQALPGAKPVIWDTRRGKAFRLRANTNRRSLGACLRGLAAKYLREWDLAA
ncbi:hypothetical protein [Amycolatopsis sp. NPDC059657]|uniref:hypothetical protein n=1 Tax=Amycolatopsis sp. NPDC059657 TaxID=3346899 RepID=UPI00366D8183